MSMRHAADSDVRTHRAKAEPGSADYPAQVACPMMAAIDAMPKPFRECVHEFGYVDVYRAWRRGWSRRRSARPR
jgi:hypothetical protein